MADDPSFPHIATLEEDGRLFHVTVRVGFDGIEHVGRLWFTEVGGVERGLPDRAAIPGRSRDDVVRALRSLRSAPLLTGFRGRPPADVDALADLVVRLTDAVVGTDVVEIELNPVLVGSRGATAVDALLIVED